MTDDRVYPASKTPIGGGAGPGGAAGNPTFPATKSQLYGANRPTYRPQPGRHRQRHRRGCCCRCCCWTIFLLILLILLAAAAAAVIYLIYRPQRPSFAVSSIKISALNFTSATHLTTAISVTVTAKNPNKNVDFTYNPTAVTVYSGDGDVVIGKGSFPPFVHGSKNTTVLKSMIGSPPEDLDEPSANKLKTDLKNKHGLPLKIVLDTKVKVKMGALKTPRTGIRVSCEGIKASAPTGKKATTASTSDVKCKVDLRFKVWKFTF